MQQEEWGRASEGRRGSLVGYFVLTPAHRISAQRLLSVRFKPLSWPDEASDEAVCFNQMLRRKKSKGPGQ